VEFFLKISFFFSLSLKYKFVQSFLISQLSLYLGYLCYYAILSLRFNLNYLHNYTKIPIIIITKLHTYNFFKKYIWTIIIYNNSLIQQILGKIMIIIHLFIIDELTNFIAIRFIISRLSVIYGIIIIIFYSIRYNIFYLILITLFL